MSNVNPPFQNLSLDPAEMIAVNEAYDLACRTLQNIGQLEVDREIIARGILRAVKTGERDANKLCEHAIHGLTAFDYRQHDGDTAKGPAGPGSEDHDGLTVLALPTLQSQRCR